MRKLNGVQSDYRSINDYEGDVSMDIVFETDGKITDKGYQVEMAQEAGVRRDYERMFGLSLTTNLAAGITLYSEFAGFNHNYRNYYDAIGRNTLNDGFYGQGVIGSYILLSPKSGLSFFSGDASLTLEAYYTAGDIPVWNGEIILRL